MADKINEIDWSGVEERMALRILDQGEIYLRAQLDSALASDQRATTMGSVVAAIASALLAAVIAYWDKTGSNQALYAGIATALVLLISAGFCMWAARPVDFYYPGNQPAHWYPIRRENFVEAIGGEAENYESHIEKNDIQLGDNQKALKWGGFLVVAAPIVGLGVWLWPICPFYRG